MADEPVEQSPFTPAESLIAPDKETPAELTPPNPETGGGVYLVIDGQKVALAEAAKYIESHNLEIVIRPKESAPVAAEQPTPAEVAPAPEPAPNPERAKIEAILNKPPIKLGETMVVVDTKGTKLRSKGYGLGRSSGYLCIQTESRSEDKVNKFPITSNLIEQNPDSRFVVTLPTGGASTHEMTILSQEQKGGDCTVRLAHEKDGGIIEIETTPTELLTLIKPALETDYFLVRDGELYCVEKGINTQTKLNTDSVKTNNHRFTASVVLETDGIKQISRGWTITGVNPDGTANLIQFTGKEVRRVKASIDSIERAQTAQSAADLEPAVAAA